MCVCGGCGRGVWEWMSWRVYRGNLRDEGIKQKAGEKKREREREREREISGQLLS